MTKPSNGATIAIAKSADHVSTFRCWRDIVEAVVEFTGISEQVLRSDSRARDVVFARYACMWVAREFTRMTLGEIGRDLGGRDHTTVSHGLARVRDAKSRAGKSADESEKILAHLVEIIRQRVARVQKIRGSEWSIEIVDPDPDNEDQDPSVRIVYDRGDGEAWEARLPMERVQ